MADDVPMKNASSGTLFRIARLALFTAATNAALRAAVAHDLEIRYIAPVDPQHAAASQSWAYSTWTTRIAPSAPYATSRRASRTIL